ncbi:MAG TPA: DUF4062 domain-containing protein [Pyrinomonadaceae bacterium]|nr:DUF4062 domain-containing protein [Pyrinomonadaceae bacterium]
MKVFLSSTAEDLAEYRRIADDTILRLAQESLVMERFGPRPGTPIEECERLARESEMVICIVAHRYGSIPERGDTSFTQREVEAAHKAGKKVLAWIVADDFKWTEKKEQDLFLDPTVFGNPAREGEVKERIRKLVEFKAWLRKTVIHESFTTADDLGRKIAVALSQYIPKQSVRSIQQGRISISRLPTTSSILFGREGELKILDDAWPNPQINIVSFVAWAGAGKTALVNHWLKQHMARNDYRGAERVYGWSFFSQGVREQGSSADLFIDQALRWFGDDDPSAGGPWDKGQRLAQYLRQSRTLLILDGLEPLQHPPGPQEGGLKDAAMQALLVELAAHQPGLCVISTRERIADLNEFQNSTVLQLNLDDLSPQAGAQLLCALNVQGDVEELESASEELDGHALSLTLLGSYLQEVLDGDIRRRHEIENLFDDFRHGSAAEKMISAYEKWLGEGMELAILRLLGLFDRPADLAGLMALRESPAIAELTEPLQHFKGREWNQAVAKLRRIKLLAEASSEPGTLDAHPLIRDYFKRQLKTQRPNAWRKANERLYEHLKNVTKKFPETVEEMSPLFAAIAHGCAAGLYQDALDNVYAARIQRGMQYFNKRELGAMATELATLSNFFEEPWERPVEQLRVMQKGFVLHEVGADLKSQGRLHEAAQAMQAAMEIAIANSRLRNASTAASNLAELYLTVGNLEKALHVAQRSVDLAISSGEKEENISSLTTLGHVWHQLERVDNALIAFNESEILQQQFQPNLPSIYSANGFRYCDLLLDQGQLDEVKRRANYSLEALKTDADLLSTGLDNLSLGRAELQAAQDAEPAVIASMVTYFQRAVDSLRKAAHVSYLCLGLKARAEFHRFRHDSQSADRDLSELLRLVTRSGMNLYLADYHLESARLRLATSHQDKAREHLTTAKEMVNRMVYHRRDKEVAELEAQLG